MFFLLFLYSCFSFISLFFSFFVPIFLLTFNSFHSSSLFFLRPFICLPIVYLFSHSSFHFVLHFYFTSFSFTLSFSVLALSFVFFTYFFDHSFFFFLSSYATFLFIRSFPSFFFPFIIHFYFSFFLILFLSFIHLFQPYSISRTFLEKKKILLTLSSVSERTYQPLFFIPLLITAPVCLLFKFIVLIFLFCTFSFCNFLT